MPRAKAPRPSGRMTVRGYLPMMHVCEGKKKQKEQEFYALPNGEKLPVLWYGYMGKCGVCGRKTTKNKTWLFINDQWYHEECCK